MPKNIVLLSDGTGNNAGKLQKTNVWRLYDALELPHPGSPNPPNQIAYYDDGVGSSSFLPLAIAGGALGWGLKRNLLDQYTFLCRNYEEGDSIYAFGFSRGAFTIRVLVGLIHSQGLARAETNEELRSLATDAYRRYRENYVTFGALQWPARAVRNMLLGVKGKEEQDERFRPSPDLTFLGLWDTVSAYGLPFDELTRAWNRIFPLSVTDRNLCSNVKRACHALSLDDARESFQPVLWNEEGLPTQPPAADHIEKERLSQVWFAGVHANVGGGYPDDGMANVTLHWIMTEAHRLGVLFKPHALDDTAAASDIYGPLYDPRRGLGGAYRYLPRKVSALTDDINPRSPKDRVIIGRPKIHESVLQRIAHATDAYAPIALPPHYAVVTAQGDIQDMPAPIAAPAVMETAPEGAARANRQEEVWNLVWWKRVVYFISVFAGLFLIVFPLFRPAIPACQEPLCSVSPVIVALGAVLPDITKPWLAAYASHPLAFLLGLAVFAVLLNIGGRLQAAINDNMRGIWSDRVPPPVAAPTDLIYRLRTSPAYQSFWRQLKWRIVPVAVAVPVLWLILAMASHVAFSIMNAAGFVCTPTPSNRLVHHTLKGATFDPREVCWASGVVLQEGIKYRITMTINKRDWKDKDIETPISGFGVDKMTGAMYLALPFRRYLTEPWYKPIARIGSTGSDEYPLNPGYTLVWDPETTVVTDISARRSGELFLFVNDAVLPVSNASQPTYKNNGGTAAFAVVPLTRTD